ncbi:MAG: ATP-binding protein [Syntrophobacteraceae bacterium]
MKIKKRLKLTTAVSIISALAIISSIVLVTRQNDRDFHRSGRFYQMEQRVYALNLLTASYLLHPRERVREQWESAHRSLEALFAGFEVNSRHERKLLEAIKTNHQDIIIPFSQLVSIQTAEDVSPLADNLKEMLSNRVSVQLGVMLDNTGRLVESTQVRISKSQRWANSFSIVAVLILAGIGVILILDANRILKAVMQLHDAAGHIVKEDWDHRIEVKGDDEIAGLARAFNNMSLRLGSSYAALQAEIAEKELAEEAVRQINETLEQRVTERTAELAETVEKLNHAHALTRTILDTVDGLIMVLDRNGGIVRFNAACERLTGWAADEVSGRCFWEFLVPEEQRAGVIDTFKKLTSGFFPSRYENEWLLRYGGRRWITWANSSLLNAEGGVEYVIGTGIDITERKRMEEELRKSKDELELRVKERTGQLAEVIQELEVEVEERKRATDKVKAERQQFYDVLETLPVYVTLLAPDHRVLFANRVFRKRFGEPKRLRCYEHLFGRKEPCETCETHKVLKSMAHSEWEWTGPDGRDYRVFDFPFTDTDGSSLILEMGIDITERNRAEAKLNAMVTRLEQSNQALQDFATIASHDMQEPLRKVISFGNMLRQKHKDSLGEKGNDYLDRMLGATQRMQSLLKSLLEYSRVTTNPEPFKEVDLSDIIHEVISDLEVRIERTGGEVHIAELPAIKADPTQMRQLFQNLIGNALKFHEIGQKPIVKVHGSPLSTSGIQIIVEDNGIGFDEQYSEKIFAPFQRLCGKDEYEGTGIGLAICKKIVERHGGSLTAMSQPGAGSRFIITLPLNALC